MANDRHDVCAALRDMRKDVEEAETSLEALDAETHRLRRFIRRKRGHIQATERLMTRGLYCMNDHVSEDLESDAHSEDDFRPPAPEKPAAPNAAQSD